MKTRIILTSALCAALGSTAASAQPTNMSDASGALIGMFSRGIVRAFAAPPAPPPTLIVTTDMLAALCVERADAIALYTSLSAESPALPERNVLALLRGGPAAADAGQRVRAALLDAGAGAARVNDLVWSLNGLLAADRPEVPDVATAVARYNELVASAPITFLAAPPPELTAVRMALGRLTAAANGAFAAERTYPDLPRAHIRYANDAFWLESGVPIHALNRVWLQYGEPQAPGERRFTRVGEYDGIWLLAESYEAGAPRTIYMPLRTYCDVQLVPFTLQEPVIKRMK